MTNEKRFTIGKIKSLVCVARGLIESLKFEGDFLGLLSSEALEAILEKTRYNYEGIFEKLSTYDLSLYFGDIPADELSKLIVGQ